jgi:hypothetical protein
MPARWQLHPTLHPGPVACATPPAKPPPTAQLPWCDSNPLATAKSTEGCWSAGCIAACWLSCNSQSILSKSSGAIDSIGRLTRRPGPLAIASCCCFLVPLQPFYGVLCALLGVKDSLLFRWHGYEKVQNQCCQTQLLSPAPCTCPCWLLHLQS